VLVVPVLVWVFGAVTLDGALPLGVEAAEPMLSCCCADAIPPAMNTAVTAKTTEWVFIFGPCVVPADATQ
jgi:hypothetical protein